ncbi:MAG: hypothetical protein WA395_01800 [Nitrososphaeraceae archaeon]
MSISGDIRLNLGIIAANNYYTDFGLELLNTFRKMLDLSEVTRNDVVKVSNTAKAPSSNTKQTSISDF